jgi:adenine phosphoribosyltransferase
MDLCRLIRDVPDFPQPGIVFKDITPLLADPAGFRYVTDQFVERYQGRGIERIVAIESRGFIFGAPLALALKCGFAPVRKLGKLPRQTVSREYSLEYGKNHVELHVDAVERGQRVLIVDDVLATGGTARAAVELVEQLGGVVVGVAFVIELTGLNGRSVLQEHEVVSLLTY